MRPGTAGRGSCASQAEGPGGNGGDGGSGRQKEALGVEVGALWKYLMEYLMECLMECLMESPHEYILIYFQLIGI